MKQMLILLLLCWLVVNAEKIACASEFYRWANEMNRIYSLGFAREVATECDDSGMGVWLVEKYESLSELQNDYTFSIRISGSEGHRERCLGFLDKFIYVYEDEKFRCNQAKEINRLYMQFADKIVTY